MALNLFQKVFIYTALFLFALFNWFMFLCIAIFSGTFFKKPSEQDQQQLALSRDQLWNLSKQPVPGFVHSFYKLRSGHKLHFITNRDPNGSKTPSDLVVFIHGFPDSSMIWRKLLEEPATPGKLAAMVCVDLPGFGGSDSFEKYDTRTLDALSEFIVGMRERYTQGPEGFTVGTTYVMGHDWGCVLTLRLAAEAPGLADRFLTSNGPLFNLTQANARRIVASASKIFKQFRAAPLSNFGLLKKTFVTLRPLIKQAMLSGYIFVFNLPALMVQYLGSGGYLSFQRGVIERAHAKEKTPVNVYEVLGSLRPGPLECDTAIPKSGKGGQAETYGPSVAARVGHPGRAWWEMCGYYRYGLSYTPWEKSLETVTDLYNLENNQAPSPDSAHPRRSSSASAAMFAEHLKGSLRAPMTMIWGADDLALSKALCLEGIGDYLAKDSEVINLPHSGHWTPVETDARAVWAIILKTLIEKPKGQAAPTSVIANVKKVYADASVYAKR